MSKPDTSPIQHQVSYEVGVLEKAPVDGWRERVPAPNARASCTCGQLDTGLVGSDEAWRAAQEHVKRYLPGVDWGPDIAGAPRPLSDHCRPGRCMGLMCCSYECSQGRCPSIPAEFREPAP